MKIRHKLSPIKEKNLHQFMYYFN